MKAKWQRRNQAQRIRSRAPRIGSNRKAARAGGAHEHIDVSSRNFRQVRGKHHNFSTTELAEHAVRLGERMIERLAGIGEDRYSGGEFFPFWGPPQYLIVPVL